MGNTQPHRWTNRNRGYYLFDTKREVFIGPDDDVIDFRGGVTRVQSVSRGKEYNGTAKVCVAPHGWEYYSTVYELEALPVVEPGKTYQLDIYSPATMVRQLRMARIRSIRDGIVSFDMLDDDGEDLGGMDLVSWNHIFIANEVGVHDLIPVS